MGQWSGWTCRRGTLGGLESAIGSPLRERKPHEHGTVTFVALFSTLVFALAIGRLPRSRSTSRLSVRRTWRCRSGAALWGSRSEQSPARLVLFGHTRLGSPMSASIPEVVAMQGAFFRPTSQHCLPASRYVVTAWAEIVHRSVGKSRQALTLRRHET